jgi:hypothetical protein
MAPTRKSAKRSAGKKRSGAKRASGRKRPSPAKKRSTRKSASSRAAKRGGRKTSLKRRAEKGIQAARGGLGTVVEAGERTWQALRSTTAQVVEGVKERLGEDSRSDNDSRSGQFSR